MPNFTATLPLRILSLATLTICALTSAAAFAQSGTPVRKVQLAALDLPDAPSTAAASSSSLAPAERSASFADPKTTHASLRVAGVYDTVIQPGQTAPRLTATNEFVASLKSSISPTAIVGWAISAGYSQLTDGSPNYETGSVARQYGQRIGAAAARSSSETIFGNGIIAPLVHQDPRYYRMGPGNNFFKRAAYAVTRPVITRTNGGKQTLNLWDLGGDLSGAALTPAYYPPLNTGFNEVMRTWGGSIGGDALAFAVSEFLPDILHTLHLRRAE